MGWKFKWFLRLLCLISVVVLSAPFAFRFWTLSQVPDVSLPFDVSDHVSVVVAPENNAAAEYEVAKTVLVEPSYELEELLDQVLEQKEGEWKSASLQLEKYIVANEQALLAWKLGTEKPFFVRIPLAERHVLSTRSDSALFRLIPRNAILKSCLLELEGRNEEALDWIVALMKNSRQMGHHGCVIDRLIGTSLLSLSLKRLERWSAQDELNSSVLKRALRELETISTQMPKNSHVLKGDYVTCLNTIQAINGKESSLRFEELIGQPNADTGNIQKLQYFLGEPEFSRRVTTIYVGNQLKCVDRPYYERPLRVGALQLYDEQSALIFGETTIDAMAFNADLPILEFSYAHLFTGAIVETFPMACDRVDVKVNAMKVILAGQAYRRERGGFPSSLEDLIPDYLSEIPVDPFDGKTMKYRNSNNETPIVYSVFENQIDDDGVEYDYDTTTRKDPLDYGMRMLRE